jgi:hypothetical protein
VISTSAGRDVLALKARVAALGLENLEQPLTDLKS